MTYEENVASFERIDSAKADELVKGEGEAVIYVGKSVCPFCQLFVEKLNKVAKETDAHIYYLDSMDNADMKGVSAFRSEYDIPTVPGFIYKNGDTVNVISDSSMSEDAIKAYMHK